MQKSKKPLSTSALTFTLMLLTTTLFLCSICSKSICAYAYSMKYQVAQDGEVTFINIADSDSDSNSKISEMIKEYSGKIILKNNKFYYTNPKNSKNIQIGTVTPLAPLICTGIYSKICNIYFGHKSSN
ncbi:MAG: hypothetical protein HQK51_13970, partial [Oligoflexia bacterium]|nr:hypothetical protein [Oligoflexia bacterium]